MTVVMITHSLSTVRNADIVICIAAGAAMTTGVFEEIHKVVPDFHLKAKLMGL